MAPRVSHRKSRKGCLTCKVRRVKCDECGPPCGNCKAGERDCQYVTPIAGLQVPAAKVRRPKSEPGHQPENYGTSIRAAPHCMELALMHRWSTATYSNVSCARIGKDDTVWQMSVSDTAMKHDFLLNGLFALSAYEIAGSCSNPSYRARYLNSALEYQDQAYRSYRAQLIQTKPDGHEAMLYFSMLLLPLNFASFQSMAGNSERDCALDNSSGQFALHHGLLVVVKRKPDVFARSVFSKIKPYNQLPRIPLSDGLKSVLGKLFALNERRHPPNFGQTCAKPDDEKIYIGCKTALYWLSETFTICLQNDFRGYCLTWIVLAGNDFSRAVQQEDQVSLLILMYWGLLVELLGRDYWWVKGYGQLLINEICSKIPINADETTKELIAWAQKHVGEDLMESRLDVTLPWYSRTGDECKYHG